MPISPLAQALSEASKDDASVNHFLGVWPVIESILEPFSKATQLPIFVFFNEALVFQSSLETMPPFCSHMLNDPQTSHLCFKDGLRRAAGQVPDVHHGIQMCHAGMLNGRRAIETGLGTLTILFGSKKSTDAEAIRRRERLVQIISSRDEPLAERLQEAACSDLRTGEFETSDIALMDAITDILQRLINATAGFRQLTTNMAHELSLMMIGVGLLTRRAGTLFNGYKSAPSAERGDGLSEMLNLIDTQCQLGLYIVRNFFSHTSETRYGEVIKPRFSDVNVEDLLNETLHLHRSAAAEKNVVFDPMFSNLPVIRGFDMELRRLFSNVINNAIKYSYHSVPNAQRVIRVRSKVPFDPGFRQRRFAITFENYGLGLTEQERRNVFKPGFRSRQAIAEVPIGSGIGLSEAQKIMKLHGGEIKFTSKELHGSDKVSSTYLTTVDLIFPYAIKRAGR